MKKDYVKPSIKVVKTEPAHILCASGNVATA